MAVTVREIEAQRASLRLELVTGSRGLARTIEAPRVQKPALALAGYLDQLHPGRIQVLGNAELGYVRRLPPAKALAAVEGLCRGPVACVVVTNGNDPPPVLRRCAARHRIALFTTEQRTAAAIRLLHRWLEERFAPETSVHGVLMDLFGLGVLLLGKSGVGKSEAALVLLNRGHRLIADDVVMLREAPPGHLRGRCNERLKHHLEVRGLGILGVTELFGTLATLDEAPVDMAIELVDERSSGSPDRLGIEDRYMPILGVEVPHLQLQLRPGREIATLIEVAARNQLLKLRGIHAARRFVAANDRSLRRASAKGGT